MASFIALLKQITEKNVSDRKSVRPGESIQHPVRGGSSSQSLSPLGTRTDPDSFPAPAFSHNVSSFFKSV